MKRQGKNQEKICVTHITYKELASGDDKEILQITKMITQQKNGLKT